jgi:hypothetical protein
MTSARRIAANRENARKSTGPRTQRGKSRASRNAVRHGLAAVNIGDSGVSDQVQRLAKAICKDESDPFRYEQAVIIAETQILLGRVRAARIAAIEPARKGSAEASDAAKLEREELRGDVECLTRALPELLNLERYERRALSRRRRAIRRLDALADN